MAVKISTYTAQYKRTVIDLILNIQRNEFGIEITEADQPDLQDIENFYIQGNGNFWLAFSDSEVVGTIALLDIGGEGSVAMRKMFVKADYRGKEHNVAQSLLTEALFWAKSRGLKNIFLGTTSKYHAAHRFYEKNQFQEIGVANLPKSFPIMKVDTKFYKKTLYDFT